MEERLAERVDKNALTGWRKKLFEVIFEADTPAGKLFDVLLIVSILASVAVVMLDSVESISEKWGTLLKAAEWVFTILFTIEYLFRLICAGRAIRYAKSFFGIVDLMAIVPTYLDLILPGSRYLLVIRLLRVLRIFRILHLSRFVGEANVLMTALAASKRKILVFFFAVLTLVVILGSLMYVIEGRDPASGFTSIPKSVYWAIVTLTTVGYGDILPQTGIGQMLAAVVMILGYSIIAVPTGIVTAELTQAYKKEITTQTCPQCTRQGHDKDAKHCKHCGASL
ncbi:MAG: ion transporter [Planctomycetes bacterium]|nr:ion transporter [Planctomycetota bacterium]